MPKQIAWVFDAQVAGGFRLSASGTQSVDACDQIHLVVAANEQDKAVELPEDDVRFLAIVPGRFDALTYAGKYEIEGDDGGTATTVTVAVPSSPIDAPMVLLGGGGAQPILRMLKWKKLEVSNSKAVDVPIEILVGRNL